MGPIARGFRRFVRNRARQTDMLLPQEGEPDKSFDEVWYLKTYPGVAEAVASGVFRSGWHHYFLFGQNEKRKRSRADVTNDPETPLADLRQLHSRGMYLAPRDLSRPDFRLRRTLVLGLCLAEAWTGQYDGSTDYQPDFLAATPHSILPTTLPHPVDEYDVFLAQMPLRAIIGDSRLWAIGYHDLDAHQQAFDSACEMIDLYVNKICTWAEPFGVPVLIANLMLPQADLTGRLLPRYDLRNIVFFFEELNRHIGQTMARFRSAHLLDIDQISASFGRRFVQDDSVFWTMHNHVLPHQMEEPPRIEPMPRISDHYDPAWIYGFVAAIWSEATAIIRTLQQIDLVKLVVVDLDDTLWSGVSGDQAEVSSAMIESWPIGLIEALLYLKKRGILLGIISKNDEVRVREIWPKIFGNRISLDDFAVLCINWQNKSENMRGLLADVNLLSENTVFIDDNPVERAEMRHAFPDMRILGRYPYYLRRILLWASETQGAIISEESSVRTQSIKAKIARDTAGNALDRSAFLASLALRVSTSEIYIESARFARAFELLNKTNQFNTTGRRWTQSEIDAAMRDGLRIFVFEAEDKFTSYGLIGVCLVIGETIEQFVMSCRVNGLDVELAALSEILPQIKTGGRRIASRLVPNPKNLLCRDLWARCGFAQDAQNTERWVSRLDPVLSRPSHVH